MTLHPVVLALTFFTAIEGDVSKATAASDTFARYANELKGKDFIIFVSQCELANGDRAMLVFEQPGRGGKYFQIRGDRTIRSEQVATINGSFEIMMPTGPRYLGDSDGAIKTLIRSYPYFMMWTQDFPSILRAPIRAKCFEQQK